VTAPRAALEARVADQDEQIAELTRRLQGLEQAIADAYDAAGFRPPQSLDRPRPRHLTAVR
jgi:hypothetical protein